MYSFDEVIPFVFSNVDSSPTFKSELFSDPQLEDNISDLCRDPYGEYQLMFEEFTSTNEQGKERTFEARTFNLEIIDTIRILDDSCEGKVFAHYETTLIDLDTKEKFNLLAYYYESNYDFIGLTVRKIKEPVKVLEKEESMFVLVQRSPEDYNILGMFKSLESVLKVVDKKMLTNQDTIQIDEIPVGSLLKFDSQNKNTDNVIDGALNSYDLQGKLMNK